MRYWGRLVLKIARSIRLLGRISFAASAAAGLGCLAILILSLVGIRVSFHVSVGTPYHRAGEGSALHLLGMGRTETGRPTTR